MFYYSAFLVMTSTAALRWFQFDSHSVVPFILIPLVLVSVSFIVWGYSIEDGALIIHHIGRKTRIPLADLESFRRDPSLTANDELTWRNIPYYSARLSLRRPSCPQLGQYDAYLNGHKNAFVLTFPSRKIVVSPSDPEEFAVALERATSAP